MVIVISLAHHLLIITLVLIEFLTFCMSSEGPGYHCTPGITRKCWADCCWILSWQRHAYFPQIHSFPCLKNQHCISPLLSTLGLWRLIDILLNHVGTEGRSSGRFYSFMSSSTATPFLKNPFPVFQDS